MPMVGMASRPVMCSASGAGMASSTMEKQPAASRARASSISWRAAWALLPWTLKPPRLVAVCGVRPMCPCTGMPAATMAATVLAMVTPPSTLTASARPSLRIRTALSMAAGMELEHEPNGMSVTTRACSTPRTTALVWWIISSMVTDTVSV